jgi:hypothetical protein
MDSEDQVDITLAKLVGAYIRRHHGQDDHLWKWYGPNHRRNISDAAGFGWQNKTEGDAAREFLAWHRKQQGSPE